MKRQFKGENIVTEAAVDYANWSATCDALHGYSQVLGKLSATLAPPQPQLQHAALTLTARGWETLPLPAPNGSGVFGVVLDLRKHQAVIEHSNGNSRVVELTPNRSVGEVTRGILAGVAELAGLVKIDMAPQELWWDTPLDEDESHATYDTEAVSRYFQAATQAAQILAIYRAPYRGRSTPVNAWWGSFDLAVSLFSGKPATPPSDSFIMRNAMDAQEISVGWWPGDPKHPKAAFYAYSYPAPDGYSSIQLDSPLARWDDTLGEFILDWSDVTDSVDPQTTALKFLCSARQHACLVGDWGRHLLKSAEGNPPPIC